jgi:DNA-binding beta-propeller fold protein YncE
MTAPVKRRGAVVQGLVVFGKPPLLGHFGLLVLALVCLVTVGKGQPAQYLFDVAPPAGALGLLRPSSVYFDPRQEEIYIADTGNNRVVIFDKNGNYVFEFSDYRHLSAPEQIAVDSLGRIFVLSSSRREKLAVFDYNGTFLHDLVPTEYWMSFPFSDSTLAISSFLLDERDGLFVLRSRPAHVYVYTSDGQPLYEFPLFEGMKAEIREQPLLGNLALVNGTLVIPMPMFSQVARYTKRGKFIDIFGFLGGGRGELGFPIAAAADGQGGILVLDKHRHAILQFRDDGSFVREVGGMGSGPGWFYHPRSLAVNEDGQCYVAQTFMSRVQAVQVVSGDVSRGDENVDAQAQSLLASPEATQQEKQ